jgi:HK97 family phage major capsid protein
VDETPTAGTADTNLTFGMEKLPIHTVMAETFLSRNLIEDAAFDLAGYLADKFAEASAIDEDNRFITGDGVGKPLGLLPGGGNPAGTKQLTEANSGAAAAVTWDGLIDLAYSIASQYRQNAVWIGERLTLRNIRKLKDGDGRYLWEINQQAAIQPPFLMGFPVLEQETLPTIAANAYPLLFGDPRGYTIVDRIGATIERYLDASTARTNSVIYIMRQRMGGQPTETYRWAVQKISA